MNSVDEFILFDEVQFTKRDWRNRNLIKTPQGPLWLTIPISVKGKYHQKIKDARVSDLKWGKKHWKSIKQHFAKADYFNEFKDTFEKLYLDCNSPYLSEINYRFIVGIQQILNIKTKISWSGPSSTTDGKTERIIDICRQLGATEYVSGPLAKGYLDGKMFEKEGLTLRFFDYSGYPPYRQLFPPFEHKVSILDLIFNEGSNAQKFMKSF